MTSLAAWQREVAAQVAPANPITPTTPIRARGNHLSAMNDEPELSDADLIERKFPRAVQIEGKCPQAWDENNRQGA